MFDFQVEKSLPTHENYYVKLNDYFIAYTYIFNVFFFILNSCFFFCELCSGFCLPSVCSQEDHILTPSSLKCLLFFGEAPYGNPFGAPGSLLIVVNTDKKVLSSYKTFQFLKAKI